MLAAVLGLAALMHTGALAFQSLKSLGVAYLLYMAWSRLDGQGALKVETELGARSATQVITAAILVNPLNPKLSIFFFAFLPQFVHADEPRSPTCSVSAQASCCSRSWCSWPMACLPPRCASM